MQFKHVVFVCLLRAWLHGEFQPGQPGWNFVAITWRTSAWAEILASAPKSLRMSKLTIQPGLKFRFDYMRVFQIFWPVCPGWIAPRAKSLSM